MQSKRSFFNSGVCRNLLRRCWPLWAGYFALLLFLLPVSLAKIPLQRELADGNAMNLQVLQCGVAMIYISFVMAILTAMVMFSYLYNSRSCGMMNALPIRRETMFLTVMLTGLVPMLLIDLLVMLITAAIYCGQGTAFGALLLWLLMAVCANLAFYGFAVFCAMLTGSLFVLPAVYLVLGLAAAVAESCLRTILSNLVYGLSFQGTMLLWLSPIVKLFSSVWVMNDEAVLRVEGLRWLIIYAAAGIVLLALSLLLYRKRQMETASDTVAVPILKPIFQYCMALGTAVVFASLVYSLLLGGSFHGTMAALILLTLLLIGAFLGWLVAEMLIRRTVRVFPGHWKRLLISCAALALLVTVSETDLLGCERFVPRLEDVDCIEVNSIGFGTIRDPVNIQNAIEVHETMIAHKAQHEGDIHVYGNWFTLRYILKSGRTVERSYYLANWRNGGDCEDLSMWQDLLNCPELLQQYCASYIPVSEETVHEAQIISSWIDGNGNYQSVAFPMTQKEALDFYNNCLLPDLEAGTVGRRWMLDDENYRQKASGISFSMGLWTRALDSSRPDEFDYDYLDVSIDLDSEHCMRWVREHTDLPVKSAEEAGLEDYWW